MRILQIRPTPPFRLRLRCGEAKEGDDTTRFLSRPLKGRACHDVQMVAIGGG